MSLHPNVLDALLAAGATAEMIVAAVKADAALDAQRVTDRRAKDRDRQQRHRESRRVTVTKRDKGSNDRDILTSKTPPYVISNEITPPAENPAIEIKPEHVVEVWNDLAVRHGLAAVKKITPERRKKLLTFIRRHTIDDITEAIAAIPRSPFLLGQNGRGWKASFDWFLEPRNLTKLTEATYVH